jgi:hypothetical protein
MGYYFKPIDRISQIHPGSHVRHKINKEHSFVVTANYGDRATAVLTVDITNPSEWEVWVDENDQQP